MPTTCHDHADLDLATRRHAEAAVRPSRSRTTVTITQSACMTPVAHSSGLRRSPPSQRSATPVGASGAERRIGITPFANSSRTWRSAPRSRAAQQPRSAELRRRQRPTRARRTAVRARRRNRHRDSRHLWRRRRPSAPSDQHREEAGRVGVARQSRRDGQRASALRDPRRAPAGGNAIARRCAAGDLASWPVG